MQGFEILTVFCALVNIAAVRGFSFPGHQKKNVCYDKEDGVFLPLAGSCSKYIICHNGKALEHDCGHYHFSAKLSACELPELAGCADVGHFTSQSEPHNEKDIIVPSTTLPPCFAVADGISLPVPGNKQQYYFCMNSKAFLKDCGNSMYFDVKFSVCTIGSHNADASGPKKPPVVHPTKAPSNHQPATESSVCIGKPDSIKIPVARNSHQYYFCMNNKAFLKDCGTKLVFSTKYHVCVLPSDESNTEEHEVTSKNKEIVRQLCEDKSFGTRIGFPGSCSLYVICTINNGFVKTCGWREFNSMTSSCDLPQNVRCKAYIKNEIEDKPEVHVTPKTSTSTLAERICRYHIDGSYIGLPGSCTQFYFCWQKKGFLKTCGNGRHFDRRTLMCIKASESQCIETRALTQKSERAIIHKEESVCFKAKNGILLSSPNSCGKFLICDNGIPREMDCPGGLHFNTRKHVCDLPTNTECALKK